MKLFLISISMLFMASTAISSTWIQTKIQDVRWYKNGHGFITTEKTDNSECGYNASPDRYRYFSEEDGGSEKLLSLALAALMSNKTVSLELSGCTTADPKHSILKGIIIHAN